LNPETTNREWVRLWEDFISKAKSRLEEGAVEYNDESFSLPQSDLIREIEEEILDVVTWSFILAVKVANVGERIDRQEDDSDGG
jgi:hypothetical protein